ncbi:MAG: MFS transporter [Rubrivivax sp.]
MPPQTPAAPAPMPSLRAASAVLLAGNFVVACAVMVVPGMLDQMAADLQVSVPRAGQLLSLAALAMCLGAPALAALTTHMDRRRLLLGALLAVCVGHLACAAAPDYGTLALLRPLSVLGAAVFTPQAAAAIGLMVPPAQRATAVTTIFLGWSLASVVAMPMGSLVANALGWRAAFVLIALLALLSAVALLRVIPRGLAAPALSLRAWGEVAAHPRLRLILAATLVWCAAQFTVLGYVAPALRRFAGADVAALALLMALQGLSGLGGAVLMARQVGRIGADRGARRSLALVAAGLTLWSLASLAGLGAAGMALAVAVWGFGSFAFVSSQQARLAVTAPELASASIALNSASLYMGQAVGAALGGALVAGLGYAALGPAALLTALLALALCVRADRAA